MDWEQQLEKICEDMGFKVIGMEKGYVIFEEDGEAFPLAEEVVAAWFV